MKDKKHDGNYIAHFDARFTGTFDMDHEIGASINHDDEFALFVRVRASKANMGETKTGGIKRTNILQVIYATPLEAALAAKLESVLSPHSQMSFDELIPSPLEMDLPEEISLPTYYEVEQHTTVQRTVDIEGDQIVERISTDERLAADEQPDLQAMIQNSFGIPEEDIFSPGDDEPKGPKVVPFRIDDVDDDDVPGVKSARDAVLEDFLNGE